MRCGQHSMFHVLGELVSISRCPFAKHRSLGLDSVVILLRLMSVMVPPFFVHEEHPFLYAISVCRACSMWKYEQICYAAIAPTLFPRKGIDLMR